VTCDRWGKDNFKHAFNSQDVGSQVGETIQTKFGWKGFMCHSFLLS